MADDSPKSVGNGVLGHLPPLPRRALSNSFLAMEQASRQREGLPLLTDADIEALKAGRPMSWESGDAASSARHHGLPTHSGASYYRRGTGSPSSGCGSHDRAQC